MTINQIGEMLDLAYNSNLHGQVFGVEGVGKTSFCKQKFSNSIIILSNELNDNNLLFLKSAFETNHVVIFENITVENLNFLLPILNNRTIMGKDLKNFFIVTSRERIDIPNSLPVQFIQPSSVAWLEWAKQNQIHPAILDAINHKDLLELHKPRDLEALSFVLRNKVSTDLVDSILTSFLGNDIETIEFIKSSFFSGTSSTPSMTPQFQQESNSLNRMNIQDYMNGGKVQNVENNEDMDIIEHLRVLIDEPESQAEIDALLKKDNIKKAIDNELRKII
ncbi:MAG: hypothetical protein OIF32_12640 [Campylobacterales bacterium]|nr:hypothetical protein [Campylobacterales bacterium]